MSRFGCSDDEPNPDFSYADANEEGEEANEEGLPVEACPYGEDQPDKRIGWLDGWNTFQYTRIEWENGNDERAAA
jgi:hypothetical protein